MKKKILYLCINDGSDMRINKEIKTLNERYDVVFLGVGTKKDSSFIIEYCSESFFVSGNHKSPLTLLKFIFYLLRILSKRKISFVHVVDEQLYMVLFPFLIGKVVVLDVFDSIFLKWNKPKEQMKWLKRILYSSVKNIIVTDENRQSLLPKFAIKKSVVIPNVPFKETELLSINKITKSEDELVICYFGSLLKDRGSEFIYNLLVADDRIKVKCAGWVCDSYSEKLINHRNVDYLGVKKQIEVNKILKTEGDYLLAIYPCNNLNNINASPNKIYDSIHTKTPIIMNSEIIVSSMIREMNLGYVVEKSIEHNYKKIALDLFRLRSSYVIEDELIDKFCWDNYESALLKLYKK